LILQPERNHYDFWRPICENAADYAPIIVNVSRRNRNEADHAQSLRFRR
jgi:hypothetical protein